MKFDFDELLKNILVNENIFKPNLTSKLSFETAMTEIQNNFKTLDLGCGCGVVGIAVLKNISSVEMCCSDLDSKSIAKSLLELYTKEPECLNFILGIFAFQQR